MTAKLPRNALGLGLRIPHYEALLGQEKRADIDFLEIISENFLEESAPPLRHLEMAAERYPIVLHGVSLNLLGAQDLDMAYLRKLKSLADRLDVPYVTDHLCWTGAHGRNHHDLLPTPYTEDLIDYAAKRAEFIQNYLERPFGIENLSSYVDFHSSTLSEWDFYTRVIAQSKTHAMLDINNVYVSSVNHGFDPKIYLNAIPWSKVLQCHIAGHTRLDNGTIVDTHDAPICAEVWELYAYAWQVGGPFPTLLERDDQIPDLETCLVELRHARSIQLSSQGKLSLEISHG